MLRYPVPKKKSAYTKENIEEYFIKKENAQKKTNPCPGGS